MGAIMYVIFVIIIVLLIVGLYQKSTNAVCLSKKRLDGKTAIVTGGTTGMGLHIALDFAERGARVIIACPFKDEGTEALRIITEQTGSKDVVFKLLDLSSIKSIRQFAADIIDNEPRLDILMNNAGVGVVPNPDTEDDMNFIMQVNYFGQFLLTLLLLPLLNKTGTNSEPSRIVNTSSVLHLLGRLSIKNLNNSKLYKLQFYANSKLCLISFGHYLSKKLKSNVVVNCVDPGAVGTRIFASAGMVLGTLLTVKSYFFFKTPWQGAQTAIHVALDKRAGAISGHMFKNCELTRAKRIAYDDKIAERLWHESLKLVKLSDEELEHCFR